MKKEEFKHWLPPQGEFVFNNMKCGLGKSYAIYRIIRVTASIEDRGKLIWVVMPNHDLIEEFISKGVDSHYLHLKGKTRHGMCLSKEKIPSCRGCNFATKCKYKKQFKKLHYIRLVFSVPQHLIFARGDWRPDILIIDESINQVANPCIKVPPTMEKFIKQSPFSCGECILTDTHCYMRNLPLKDRKPCLSFFRPLRSIELKEFEPETLDEHYLKLSLSQAVKLIGVHSQGDLYIITKADLSFLKEIPTKIYNCATSKKEQVEIAMGCEIDLILQDDLEMNNDVYMLDIIMTKKNMIKHLADLSDWFDILRIPKNYETILFTKKFIEEECRDIFENIKIQNNMCSMTNINVSHYGIGRGTNNFEHCKHGVLYGRLSLPEKIKMALYHFGYDEELSSWIGTEEELQALHRSRPYLDDDVKLFLFTNSLKKELSGDVKMSFTPAQLDVCKEMINDKEKFAGLSKSQIYKKVKGKKGYMKKALDVLEEFGWITDSINEYGGKLKWK